MTRIMSAFLSCTILLACAISAARAQNATNDIVLTEMDNGKDVTLSGKQKLVIKLPVTSGTGYGWSALMTPDSILAFADNPAEAKPAATGTARTGGSSQTVLSFRSVRYTETYASSFTLIYCRAPCNPGDRGTKTFRIGVTTKQ